MKLICDNCLATEEGEWRELSDKNWNPECMSLKKHINCPRCFDIRMKFWFLSCAWIFYYYISLKKLCRKLIKGANQC